MLRLHRRGRDRRRARRLGLPGDHQPRPGRAPERPPPALAHHGRGPALGDDVSAVEPTERAQRVIELDDRRRRRAGRRAGPRAARARGAPRPRDRPARQPAHAERRGGAGPARRPRSWSSSPAWCAPGGRSSRGTVAAVADAVEGAEPVGPMLDDVVWRHRQTVVTPRTAGQKRYVDAIRAHTITFGIGPAGTGKTYLAVAIAAAALTRREVGPHHPHAARRGGRRAARLPARRPRGQGQPLPAPAVRRALRHARRRAGRGGLRPRPDRGRAAGLHARPDPQRQLHHPRRGPEHDRASRCRCS